MNSPVTGNDIIQAINGLPEATQTLKNKTIAYGMNTDDNIIKCNPTIISTDTTINPTGDMVIEIDTDNVVLTLGTAPIYTRVLVSCRSVGYIKFNTVIGPTVAICINGRNYAELINIPYSTTTRNRWSVVGGNTLLAWSGMKSAADLGISTPPNDWKTFIGNGTFSYIYSNASTSTYDIPEQYVTVTVSHTFYDVGTAVATKYGDSTTPSPIWTRKQIDSSTWQASWTKFSGDDATATLINKTIDAKDNTILNTPVSISTSQTYNFTTGAKILSLDTENIVVTLGTPPATGNHIWVRSGVGWEKNVYVIIGSSCICLAYGDNVEFIYDGGWRVADGTVLKIGANAVANAPSGYIPNNWKDYIGRNVVLSYYGVNRTDYDLPVDWSTVYVNNFYAIYGTALCISSVAASTYNQMWITYRENSAWIGFWNKFTGGGSGTVHGNTITSGDFANTMYWWSVVNGVCYIHTTMITSVTGNTQTVVTDLPKAKQNAGSSVMVAGSPNNLAWMYINANTTNLIADVFSVNGGNGSFSYPVADDWVES